MMATDNDLTTWLAIAVLPQNLNSLVTKQFALIQVNKTAHARDEPVATKLAEAHEGAARLLDERKHFRTLE
jgi:hypothetical protein